ncbi:MAG: magnesium transporter [Planctomycetota bacterium]|nr:MAG: magnesium transporter [Planctomycetota bacterium]
MDDFKENLIIGLQQAMERSDWETFTQHANQLPVQDVADFLFYLNANQRIIAFRALPRELAGDVFAYLDPEIGERLIRELSNEEAHGVFAELSPDDRAALLHELPAAVTKRLLATLPPHELTHARAMLGYPEESVGRRMTPEYMSVRANWTIQTALDHIRSHGQDREILSVIFVTDDQGRLQDSLRLRRFVLGDPNALVESIMDRKFISVSAFDDQEEAAQTLQHYDLLAMPVTDSQGILIGVVSIDDIMDVAEEEVTEDFHRVGAVNNIRTSLREATLTLLWRKRISWLVILVGMNIFSGAGIAYFEDTIEAMVALVFFLPLLIDSGGNAGSQSATLMVRALAVGDVRISDWTSLLGREITVALMLGVTMAAAVSLVAYYRAPEVMVIVALTMICTVLVGSVVGMLLPFLLTKLRMDPATASAPLITSIADICGVLIYFSIATWWLGL